jgi:hypothetical protein
VLARLSGARELVVARYCLTTYARSGWLWGEFVLVLAQFGVLSVFPGNAMYWFGLMNQGLGAQTILGTIVIVRRGLGARAFVPLSRLPSRGPYVRGMALASAALRVPLYLWYLALVLTTNRMTDPTVSWILAGSVGVVAGCIVIAAVTTALCPPVVTRRGLIVFFVWLVAAMSAFHVSGALAPALQALALPLYPLAATFSFGWYGGIGAVGVGALLLDAIYVAAALALASHLLARRDLLAR